MLSKRYWGNNHTIKNSLRLRGVFYLLCYNKSNMKKYLFFVLILILFVFIFQTTGLINNLQKVFASANGYIGYSATQSNNGDSYGFALVGGPANTSGTLHKQSGSGSWTTQSNWIKTDSSGNANKGPWTCSNGADDPQVNVYISWPDGSKTNSASHHCNYSTGEQSTITTNAGTGTLTINGSFGTYTMTNSGNPYSQIRSLTQDEINQISITVYKPGLFSDTPVVSGAKINQSFNLPVWTYGVRVDKMPSGWGMVVDGPFFCNLSVKPDGKSSCLIGFYTDVHWLGTNATTSPGNNKRYPVTTQAEQGPAAVLPQPNPAMASVTYQKILTDLTGTIKKGKYGNLISNNSIGSVKTFSYGGKRYLLVVESDTISKTSDILVYNIVNPLTPTLMKDNKLPFYIGSSPIISLDNYKYFFTSNPLVSQNSSTMNVFQFDPSGTITFVNSYPNMYADYLFNIKDKVYAGIFYHEQKNPTEKTYPGDPVVAGIGTINVGNGEDAVNGTTQTIPDWTNPILFYDITTNPNFSDSNIIGGYRHKLSSSFDAGEFFREPVSNLNIYNGSPVYTSGNSSYLVTMWGRSVHRTHSTSDNLTVLDISDISNPKAVMDESLSDIFGTTKDNTRVENTCLDNDGENYPIFSLSDGRVVIIYNHRPADLAMFDTTGCYMDSLRPDGGFLIRFARVRGGIIGFDISDGDGKLNFSEVPNSRQVLSECSGASSVIGPNSCGSDAKNINFGTPLTFDNGLLIGSQGKIALISDSNGFSYMNTSSEFDKFLSNIATTIPYAQNKSNPAFSVASLNQIDSKTFALYVGDQYHLQVMKISLASSVGSPVSGGGTVTISGNIPTSTLQNLQQSLFSFQNLLNAFKKILGK